MARLYRRGNTCSTWAHQTFKNSVCVCMHPMQICNACRGQKEASHPLELEFQAVVGWMYGCWVLGTEIWVGAASALNCRATLAPQQKFIGCTASPVFLCPGQTLPTWANLYKAVIAGVMSSSAFIWRTLEMHAGLGASIMNTWQWPPELLWSFMSLLLSAPAWSHSRAVGGLETYCAPLFPNVVW